MLVLLLKWLCSELDEWTDLAPKKKFFFVNLFSSMLWAAQGGDGAELDQIKHNMKSNSANWEKDYFFSRMGSLIWFTAQVYEWVNWHKGDSEYEQLGTRMMGLTMFDRPDLCQIKMTSQPFLKKTHVEKPGQKSTRCKKAAWKPAVQPENIHLSENLMHAVPWLWNLLHIHIHLAEVWTGRCMDYV